MATLASLCMYPYLSQWLGKFRAYQLAMSLWPFVIAFSPIMNMVARHGTTDFSLRDLSSNANLLRGTFFGLSSYACQRFLSLTASCCRNLKNQEEASMYKICFISFFNIHTNGLECFAPMYRAAIINPLTRQHPYSLLSNRVQALSTSGCVSQQTTRLQT